MSFIIPEKKYVPAIGPKGARLMILGEAPSIVEVQMEQPFQGPAGNELTRLLKDAGINRGDCWVSNVFKHMIQPQSKIGKKIPVQIRAKNWGINVDEELSHLQNEVNAIKPHCILALGGTALWALSGRTEIQDYRGSIMFGMGVKFVSSYHPAFLLHGEGAIGYWNRQLMVHDFKRAYQQSQFREVSLPVRTLEICKGLFHLEHFLNQYRDYIKAGIDIEASDTCLPTCIGIAFTKSHGMAIPLWDNMCNIPKTEMIQIWIKLAQFLDRILVIGQNFNYDRDKLLRLGFTVRKVISDLMMKAFAINPELPKSLAFNTSLYTEEPFYKNEGMYQGKFEDLLKGCARDACVTVEVDEAMEVDLKEIGQVEYYNNYLMKLPEMYWAIEKLGFNIDTIARDKLLYKYIEWSERLAYRLFKLTGIELNTNAPKQVKILLQETYKLNIRFGVGEEEITALLNSPSLKDENTREVLELILEKRRVDKSISTYMMALPDYDGRMRSTYFLCLETGRSSTGKQDEPIRPTIKYKDEYNKPKKKSMGIAFQTITKHGDIGADIREMYIVDNEDEVFVQADSEQAEARVVWNLAQDEEALRLVDTVDYHALTATWFFGRNSELHDYDKKKLGYEHPIRFAGKTLRHAGHLGAQKRRASIEVNTQARKYKIPIHISEAIAGQALEIFHKKQPKIREVFQHDVIEAIKNNRILIAPIPYGMNSNVGGRRMFFERYGDELFRMGFSYLPQRTVTDNTKMAGLRIKERIPNIKIYGESHDSLLFGFERGYLKEYCPIIKYEFERPIDFSKCSLPRRTLVIPCALEIGTNYCELSKYKDYTPILNEVPKIEYSNPFIVG